MNCREVRTFLSQVDGRQLVAQIPWADLNFLSSNGYVLLTSQQDHDAAVEDVERLSQIRDEVQTLNPEVGSTETSLEEDQRRAESFLFHFEGGKTKEELRQKIQKEQSIVSQEVPQLQALESSFNQLLQEKSQLDSMVPFGDGGGYISLTGLGTIILSDLQVRAYRVDDEEFSVFVDEIKSTYAELRSIANRAAWYAGMAKSTLPGIDELSESGDPNDMQASSIIWSVSIGLAKLQGEPAAIGQRFAMAMMSLQHFDSTVPNKVMAAEIMTALGVDLQQLEQDLQTLEKTLRGQGVPGELSAGVAATILAGRRYNGTYPLDSFAQFRTLTDSFESAAILAVMSLPFQDVSSRFQDFRQTFADWGYSKSEDTEIASAFLAIGELDAEGVKEKVKYAVAQLSNYLEYPLVAAAILASIPVFEVHEVLDLMEKAVTLLSTYATGIERSEVVALAVRMIHGVRNEIVKQIDPSAPIANTPVQFTYATHPGFFYWYSPIIIAHHSYFSTFSGIGAFHPAHSHGVGGFAG